MTVTQLSEELQGIIKEQRGDLEVCRFDSESGDTKITEWSIEETLTPSGLKYLRFK